MASGSQNMTTYLAKGLEKVLTTNATNTDSLLYINTADTNITADMLGATTSIAFTRMSTTGAYTTGHIVWLNAADIGTPFQLVVHDSSDLYLYKRWKSSGTWTDWVKMRAGTADTWTTARTLTIGDTGKSVDGSANVSWSKNEILGASTNAYFLRGDKAWSNTLNGAFTANGTITANGGYLKSTANSNTVTIGSQNTSFTHIYNSASIPFIFNNTVESTSGDLGTTSYPWHNIYIGPSNGAAIYYKGSKATYSMIRFIDNASDGNGNGISIGGGGQTIIGGGESASTAAAQVGTAGSEVMYVCNDGNVDIISNLQNGWDNRKIMTFNTSGYLMLPSYINVPTSNNENPTVSQFIVTNGSDHYYRKASTAHAMAAIRGSASGTWGIDISGNAATATKFNSNRTIKLTGSVTGSATTNGESGWEIATTTNHTHNKVVLVASNTAFTDTATVALNGLSIRWYSTASSFSGQPTQYGFLVTMATGDSANENHQIFATQANGDLYHRGTNGSSHASPPAFKTIIDSSNWYRQIFTNKNKTRDTLTVTDSTWSVTSGVDLFGLSFKDSGLKYTPSGGSATASTDSGDWRAWLTCASNANTVELNMRIDGSWQASKFIGPLQGNADTATKATQDGSGNTITSYYCTLTTAQTFTGTKSWGTSGAGGQLNGAATNGGINSIRIGDDVWLGDCNAGGIMGMKSTGTNCGFYFYNSSGTQIGQLYNNGSEMICNKTYHSNGGYLKSTLNGNTVQIGAQNSGCCHIYNSKDIPFAFSHGIFCVNQGDLGTTTYPFHHLILGGATNNTMTAASTNPRITFQEGQGTQPVHLIYTDYDSYRGPAGLKVIGGESATPAWFEVEGQVYAARFNGPLTGNVTGNCSGSSGSCTGNATGLTGGLVTNTVTSHGNLAVTTAKGSYYGINLGHNASGMSIMSINASHQGLYNQTNGQWILYYNAASDSKSIVIGDSSVKITGGISLNKNTQVTGTLKVTSTITGNLTGDVTGNCSGSSGSCTGNAATATKLGTANKGSSNHPIYLSGGTPTECHYPVSGNWYSAVPFIHSDGMMEIGRYIDFHGTSNMTGDHTIRFTCATNTARIDCNGIFAATGWSDLAEYRRTIEHEPGRAVIPTDCGIAKRATKRLQPGARIVSDTYGFCLGESDDEQSPIALTGRVLAYPCRPISEYHAGDAVCSGPNGTVDLMTREEIQQYPDCIIGIVNEIPTYPIWNPKHTDDRQKVVFNENVEVRGRIWIDVK